MSELSNTAYEHELEAMEKTWKQRAARHGGEDPICVNTQEMIREDRHLLGLPLVSPVVYRLAEPGPNGEVYGASLTEVEVIDLSTGPWPQHDELVQPPMACPIDDPDWREKI
jgi:hypothetical protein